MPILTPDLLRNFPYTTDRYFSFLSLLVNSYEKELASHVTMNIHNNRDMNLLPLMVQHILWAAGAVDSTAARLALQVCM